MRTDVLDGVSTYRLQPLTHDFTIGQLVQYVDPEDCVNSRTIVRTKALSFS